MRTIQDFLNNESGAQAIEYGAALAILALMILGGLNFAGVSLGGAINSVSNAVD